MAVGGEPKAKLIARPPKRIDMAGGELLDTRAIGTESKDVARGQFDGMSIGSSELGDVVKTMARIDPTISTVAKRIDHPVSISGGVERPEDNLAFVADTIAIGVAQQP